jgi:hypothetical protein
VYRPVHRSRFLIALICVVMVSLRVGGLHVHMCLDGSEPPMSFHVADSGMHHLDELDSSGTHSDRDMALASDVVVKKPFGDLDLFLLAAFGAILLFLLAPRRELLPLLPPPLPVRSARIRLRPPLRGPPRHA